MKVIIIGGMAAGPKTAARLRRLMPNADITIVERGTYISFGSCGMPFYLGNLVPEFDDLYSTSYGIARDTDFFAARKGVRVLTGTKATAIDRECKRVRVVQLDSQQEYDLEYDYLVLTTGAEPISPSLSGLDTKGVFKMHHPLDAKYLHAYLRNHNAKHVTIIGAGVIGMEVAEAFIGRRVGVAVCEAQTQVLPKLLDADMARLVEAQMKRRKVDLYTDCRVTAIRADDDGHLESVVTSSGEIKTDAVVVAVGVRPRVDLARQAGLAISEGGAIEVNHCMRTSDPFIFAAGDCAARCHAISGKEVYIPLASTANKQGRVVADNIAGLPADFTAVMGTTVLQAFEMNIGKTGLGEEEAERLGYEVITGIVAGNDAPHYYPLHGPVILKLIAEKSSGRLLGAQVCSEGDGIKRLDVLGTAMKFGAALKDIIHLDLGYAPPFAEAIDVAIHAANMLENKRMGLAWGISKLAVEKMQKSGTAICFLDIREDDELRGKPLKAEEVITISAGELRRRYHEIPTERPVVVVCSAGIRSYDAVCYLRSVGLDNAVYLEGGLAVW